MCGCTVGRGRGFGGGWVGSKIYCTLWIREAVTPNWSFWGNLGLVYFPWTSLSSWHGHSIS